MSTSPSVTPVTPDAPFSRRSRLRRGATSLRRLIAVGALMALVVVAALPFVGVSDLDLAPSVRENPDARVTTTEVAVPAVPARERDRTGSGRARTFGTAASAEPRDVVASVTEEDTEEFGMVGVSWARGTAPADLVVEVRTRADGRWGPWGPLDIEDAVDEGVATTRDGTSPVWTGIAHGVDVRLRSAESAPQDIQLTLLDGGTGLAVEPEEGAALSSTTTSGAASLGAPSRPAIRTRAQWGVDRSTEVNCAGPTTVRAARGITLHHTAGQNGYTAAQAPGIMRSMHRYHTATLGWCDIGYNFVVDAYGTIYVGRRGGPNKQVRGAHAGNSEANSYFTGISMMGNYETAPLTSAMKTSVARLMAWRLGQFGLDPHGTARLGGKNVRVIHGHRDIRLAGVYPSTATACPGRYGDAWLKSTLRGEVAAVMAGAPPAPAPSPTPAPSPSPSVPEPSTAPPAPTPTPTPKPTPTPVPDPSVRVSGPDRYATAASVSRTTFPAGARTVFLASGEDFPDALAGGPAAGMQGAPILLARRNGALPPATATELQRLKPTRVYVLGGASAVSAAAMSQAGTVAQHVQRLSGANRYATATAITSALWGTKVSRVYVASGAAYADALAGGALAATQKAPILLSATDDLPPEVQAELARLNPAEIVLLGGHAALSERAAIKIGQAVPRADVRRIRGEDRYATAAAIVRTGWKNADEVYYASGTGFADALAGVPAAAVQGKPLLLTRQACRPGVVADLAKDLGAVSSLLLGGTVALASGVAGERC